VEHFADEVLVPARSGRRSLVPCLLLAGCGLTSGHDQTTARDSGGVRLVEVREGAPERAIWTTREELSIEAPTGQEPFAFGQVVDVVLGGEVGAANAPNVVFPERLPAITGLGAGPDGTL